jgi:hypothetical protein
MTRAYARSNRCPISVRPGSNEAADDDPNNPRDPDRFEPVSSGRTETVNHAVLSGLQPILRPVGAPNTPAQQPYGARTGAVR